MLFVYGYLFNPPPNAIYDDLSNTRESKGKA